MRTIHKYLLDARGGKQVIHTPSLAQVLHVQSQSADPFRLSMWMGLDDQWPRRDRLFEFFVTGGTVPADARYISTHLFADGTFVLHLHEVYA